MGDREITLNAIINYLTEHIKPSNESWDFKGLGNKGFDVKELLELIYYVNPEMFAGIKEYVTNNEEGNNERVN